MSTSHIYLYYIFHSIYFRILKQDSKFWHRPDLVVRRCKGWSMWTGSRVRGLVRSHLTRLEACGRVDGICNLPCTIILTYLYHTLLALARTSSSSALNNASKQEAYKEAIYQVEKYHRIRKYILKKCRTNSANMFAIFRPAYIASTTTYTHGRNYKSTPTQQKLS